MLIYIVGLLLSEPKRGTAMYYLMIVMSGGLFQQLKSQYLSYLKSCQISSLYRCYGLTRTWIFLHYFQYYFFSFPNTR